ncbi:hypothetical protein Hesp01_19990 [Herbidospora sp. NBRC 101105]|nr:hypothetical protein Hesp01_19990 [Herbidospora sp. NBRC 101105]
MVLSGMYGSQSGRAWNPPMRSQTCCGEAGRTRLTEVDAMVVLLRVVVAVRVDQVPSDAAREGRGGTDQAENAPPVRDRHSAPGKDRGLHPSTPADIARV